MDFKRNQLGFGQNFSVFSGLACLFRCQNGQNGRNGQNSATNALFGRVPPPDAERGFFLCRR